MRNLVVASVFGFSALCATSVSAEYMDPSVEKKLVKVCAAIKSDSRVRLHMAIKRSGIKPRELAKGLVCNGHDPVTYAALNNANKTGVLMANKLNVDYQELLAKL
ncbi:DUF3718 domain-containing protein [Paraglaciecola chathamensis]|uniref:DUF3718 domain-containing protein n=1 Tax=Paraglaciecola chathamensis TaxID=368405 RepID=A0A8H9IFX6_9ALTE|nr:DUF3718 domain-containing protein [Paraglaciecola oceanifecundans]GGZ65876.1 hypothetical protein GCM10011274_25310 [Paraglaciecola oceanifecundans]